jgi:hypothetical protein
MVQDPNKQCIMMVDSIQCRLSTGETERDAKEHSLSLSLSHSLSLSLSLSLFLSLALSPSQETDTHALICLVQRFDKTSHKLRKRSLWTSRLVD